MALVEQRPARGRSVAPVAGRPADGLFLAAAGILYIALPVVFLSEATTRLSWLAIVGQWVVVTYAGLHLASLLRRGTLRWFNTMLWAFAYGWIGLAVWA